MPTYTLPPNTRAVGTGNPPADVDALVNIMGTLLGIATDGTGTITTGTVPLTSNSHTITATTGAATSPLDVEGSTAAGQLVFIKQTGTTDHGATIYLAGVGGSTNSALNVVSDNTAFSALQVSGSETGRGTIKVAHRGQSAGTDGSAAGLSIDLQTTVGGSTGTAAQGIFITSTTDTIPGGNAITVRYNSQDWFVVKGNVGAGNGIVGIGVTTGHTPAGMLEIAQKDTTTFGLAMTALASGTDMINLKDSGGNQRFQVNNAGNIVARANILATNNMILGTTTGDFGGAGSALTICHTTDPSTNPSSGHGIVYVDATGHLCYRGASGTVTQIAAA